MVFTLWAANHLCVNTDLCEGCLSKQSVYSSTGMKGSNASVSASQNECESKWVRMQTTSGTFSTENAPHTHTGALRSPILPNVTGSTRVSIHTCGRTVGPSKKNNFSSENITFVQSVPALKCSLAHCFRWRRLACVRYKPFCGRFARRWGLDASASHTVFL